MKPRPTKADDLHFEEEIGAIEKFLIKYWDGVQEVKPKGYEAFAVGYTDYGGMTEWGENERETQENDFDGIDDGEDGFNFVSNVAVPYVMYGDTNQRRSPLYALIAACVSYGQTRAEIYTKEEVQERTLTDIQVKLIDLALALRSSSIGEKFDQ